MMERVGVTKLDWADRWLRDGLEISRLPAVVQVVEIDMTRVVESIRLWRAQEQYVTFNHVVMRAAGMSHHSRPPSPDARRKQEVLPGYSQDWLFSGIGLILRSGARHFRP